MPKLTDTQLVILSAAAQRDQGAALPLPGSLTITQGAAASVLKSLIKKGLVEERPASAGDEIWRQNEDGAHLALVITCTGLAAIGVEPEKKAEATRTKNPSKPKKPRSADIGARAGTKQALLVNLLKRKGGATIDEAVAATGWQPHSVRGAISGALKNKLGLSVSSEKIEGRGRVYRIAAHG